MSVTNDARKSPRRRVHLRVEFARAREFVEQYAENLSSGGLFVRGIDGLSSGEEVSINITLPGLGTFTVQAEVAHQRATGGAPGVGFAIRSAPLGFADALAAYLLRLGRRADMVVFVDESPWCGAIADAGYRVEPVPAPQDVAAALAARDAQVAGIVAPRDLAAELAAALASSGKDSLVISLSAASDVGALLDRLDDALAPG